MAARLVVAAMACAVSGQQPFELGPTLRMSGGPCYVLCYAPEGDRIASGGERGEVVVCDVATGRAVHRLTAGTGYVGRVCFSPDGRRLAAVGDQLCVSDLVVAECQNFHVLECELQCGGFALVGILTAGQRHRWDPRLGTAINNCTYNVKKYQLCQEIPIMRN